MGGCGDLGIRLDGQLRARDGLKAPQKNRLKLAHFLGGQPGGGAAAQVNSLYLKGLGRKGQAIDLAGQIREVLCADLPAARHDHVAAAKRTLLRAEGDVHVELRWGAHAP